MIDIDVFCNKYKIDKNDLPIAWGNLVDIYKDYRERIPFFNSTATSIAEILRNNECVHSVKSRVKDPEHLLEKIIRKTMRKRENEPNYEINLGNYMNEITDLIGIRILHLYKDQAKIIDDFIRNSWDLAEIPTIYHRKGDSESNIKECSFNNKEHSAGYRSWHYLIKTQILKDKQIVEIQVRTIFEEGWSEIDHQLRYPYELDNQLLNEQLLVLNRLAGSADEMVSTIRNTKSSLYELNEKKHIQEQLVKELRDKLDKAEIQEQDKKFLEDKLKELENSQKQSPIPLFIKVDKGRLGLGYTISGGNIDSSYFCPNCGSLGPWNGARCMNCGVFSDD